LEPAIVVRMHPQSVDSYVIRTPDGADVDKFTNGAVSSSGTGMIEGRTQTRCRIADWRRRCQMSKFHPHEEATDLE